MDDEKGQDKPDLDLIAMIQRGRMLHDQQVVPSQVSAVYWIEAKCTAGHYPPSPQTGQWVLETTLADVDEQWTRIKAATEANQLGYKAKVSTASRSGGSESRTICVCTVDRRDRADVERVRAVLETLVPGAWHYEGDEGTADVSKP